GRCLTWVLDHQLLTLAVAIATLALTTFLYVEIPKGFFPVQYTGLIQGISEASQSVSYDAMAERQQELADAILKDPDVQSLSSFIGVDGINTTLNSGRFLINLKPRDERSTTASDVIRRLRAEIAGIPGISLYMQPVQDLTIETNISRTQYQFVLEDANPAEFTTCIPKLAARLDLSPVFAVDHRPSAAHGNRHDQPAGSALADRPSRPVSGSDRLVQPGARRLARRCRGGHQGRRARDRPAAEHDDQLPGRGA